MGETKVVTANDGFYQMTSGGKIDFLLNDSLKFYLKEEGEKKFLYNLNIGALPCIVNPFRLFAGQTKDILYRVIHTCQFLSVPRKRIESCPEKMIFLDVLMSHAYSQHHQCMVNAFRGTTKATLEQRLYTYLTDKARKLDTKSLSIPHKLMAIDLNCSREAVSRGLKKLEQKNKLVRKPRSVELCTNL